MDDRPPNAESQEEAGAREGSAQAESQDEGEEEEEEDDDGEEEEAGPSNPKKRRSQGNTQVGNHCREDGQ